PGSSRRVASCKRRSASNAALLSMRGPGRVDNPPHAIDDHFVPQRGADDIVTQRDLVLAVLRRPHDRDEAAGSRDGELRGPDTIADQAEADAAAHQSALRQQEGALPDFARPRLGEVQKPSASADARYAPAGAGHGK